MKFKKMFFMCLLFGSLIGFVSGLFGGGGGMIAVPVLGAVFKLNEQQRHATSLLVVLLSVLTGAIVYVVNGYFIWQTGFFVGLGTVAGCCLGAVALKKLNGRWVGIIFSVIVMLAGLKLLIF